VTHISLPLGAAPRTLERLLMVSGKPEFAFVSPTPLWKDLSTSLSTGDQRVNVMALQHALKAGGYYTGSISGDFTSATATAYKAWQAANGMSQTGIVDITRFAWVPRGCVITAWNVSLGGQVSSGTALASVVAPRSLVAQALVSQADITSLKVGQKAQLTIDGYTGDPFTGTISFIDSQPASSSSSGSSSSTQYTVDFRPRALPSLARAGMTGTLEVVLAQRTNVLLVPTSAVSGTSSVPYVRVMTNGTPAYRQVTTGMATSAYTQITSGLTAGEVVVTGQYSNAATSTTTTGGGSGFGGFGGGGFFRRSGGSGGSGGFPGGGTGGSGGGTGSAGGGQ
jgi:peptidoglycan hydrolase-like protein with peptidoglycan-binding domain